MSEPKPRIDEHGVPWCIGTCTFYMRDVNAWPLYCSHDAGCAGVNSVCLPVVREMAKSHKAFCDMIEHGVYAAPITRENDKFVWAGRNSVSSSAWFSDPRDAIQAAANATRHAKLEQSQDAPA